MNHNKDIFDLEKLITNTKNKYKYYRICLH